MDNSFVEFIKIYFATELSLFVHSVSFYLPYLSSWEENMAQQQQKGVSPKRNKSSLFAVAGCQAIGLHKHWCPSGVGAAVSALPSRPPGARYFWVASHVECFTERERLCVNILNKYSHSFCPTPSCQA